VCALASGGMLLRWLRMDNDARRRLTAWRFYGWFCALMVCGSCVGAVTWLAYLQSLENNFKANDVVDSGNIGWQQRAAYVAISYRWNAAFIVTYAIEFLCLSTAELLVLGRMVDFVAPRASDVLRRKWIVAARLVLGVVVVGNMVGVAGNIAAATYFKQSADHWNEAFTNYASNSSAGGYEQVLLGRQQYNTALSVAAVQSFCEVAVLLLIVAAFVGVGVACARHIGVTLRGVQRMGATYNRSHAPSPIFAEAVAQGQKLQLRIAVSVAIVFVAFVLRSAYSTLYAVANYLQDTGNRACSNAPLRWCDPCYNVYMHMAWYLHRTPEFRLVIIFISSPLALLVALRGMTDKVIAQREQYAAQVRAGLLSR
jgi:hypothetical protein